MLKTISNGFKCLQQNGISYTIGRISYYLKKREFEKELPKDVLFTEEMRKKEESIQFPRQIKFSILTPLYNTDLTFLNEMVTSVQKQTYPCWELCLCDGSDEKHSEVGEVCLRMAEKDSRIKYQRLEKNEGISANTNACIAMASGDYFGLLDHDDCLHPSALYRAMKAICEEQADFIYTDEAKFTDDPQKCFAPNFKPDFAKDDLRAHNYICHFTVYSRELLEAVGGNYRPECDGSQDHDIVLRMSEKAKKIVHIPQILYFWRVHKGSVSAGVETKAYAIEAAHRAVLDQLERVGEPGTVDSIPPYPSLYKTDYPIQGEPLVSIIVYGITTAEDLERCVRSLEEKTHYYPMEVCLVEGAVEEARFEKLVRRLPTVKPLVRVPRSQQGDTPLAAAVERCRGDYLVFLHASSMLEERDWVKELLMYAQRKDVGAVGAKLYDGNYGIYSAGIGLDAASPTLLRHFFRGEPWGSHGFEAGLCHVRNTTAVDGACLMIAKEKLSAAGGLDETLGSYTFVDLCLRLRKMGLWNVCTPFSAARLWVVEKYDPKEKARFEERWKEMLSRQDPYYNPNVQKYMIF